MTDLRKPTLRDVALLAGVSEQTVSNVLNDRLPVRQETRERVVAATHQLNYRVNKLARSLKTSRSALIAVIFPSVTNPIYAEVANVVSRAAAKRGYAVMLAISDREPANEAQLVETALDHQVAGILLSSIDPTGTAGRRATALGVPCVQLLNRDPSWTGDYFGANNVRGAREAVAALIAAGHNKIGHLRGLSSFVGDERLRGYQEALIDAGIGFDPALVALGNFSRDGGGHACAGLLDMHPEMTAIFCASDLMAYGALDEIARRGRSVPNDIALVGFDDTSFSSLAGVSLTTVRFGIEALAEASVDRLIARIEGRVASDAAAVLQIQECELVLRASSAETFRKQGGSK